MIKILILSTLLFTLLLPLALPGKSVARAGADDPPQLHRWRAREQGFAGWSYDASQITISEDGTVRLPPVTRRQQRPDGIRAGEIYTELTLPFEEAILSWNVDTPPGTWIDVLVQVRTSEGWHEKEYKMATWISEAEGSVRRQSWEGQSDTLASVQVDTLVMRPEASPAEGIRVKLRLLSESAEASPVVHNVGLLLSDHPPATPELSTGDPSRWNRSLPVPFCSQMVYPDGGEAWCSPTSTSMVLSYWRQQRGEEVGACEPHVRDAVEGVYDFVYDGHGNWPFNVAYAWTQGLEGYVTRLESLNEAEEWIARGVPLVVSFGWQQGELEGAPLPSSAGHLAVLSGFDASGNPLVHDPAFYPDASLPRAYRRDQFERLWLLHSGGVVYLMAPPEQFDLSPRLYIPILQR